jgi:hypothetical protein
LETFKIFSESFQDFKPNCEILWTRDLIQTSKMFRIDNPNEREKYSFLVKSGSRNVEKQKEYAKLFQVRCT